MRSSGGPTLSLLVLDVDGTISRIYRDHEYEQHKDEPEWRSWMSVNDQMIDALEALVGRSELDVAWLTTWPRDQVAWLVQGPLRGKLAGPNIPWQNWPKQGWRLQSLIAYVRDVRPAVVTWADDRAPKDAARRLTERAEIPSFVVRPDKFVGLTVDDVGSIDTGLGRYRES